MTPEEFKRIRKKMGLTQQQMADFLGIKNARTIRRFESGDWKISEHVIEKMKLTDKNALL